MFTFNASPCACVLLGIFLAAILCSVSGDYDANRGESIVTRSLNNDNGLCTGTSCLGSTGNGISGAMWFGPRLGRRRRSGEKADPNEAEIGAMADAINRNLWTIVSYQGTGDKRQATQFTPRLGRELADDFLQKYLGYDVDRIPRLMENNQNDFEMERQPPPPPPPPFAPRLGRQLTFIPSPRLGRQLSLFRKS